MVLIGRSEKTVGKTVHSARSDTVGGILQCAVSVVKAKGMRVGAAIWSSELTRESVASALSVAVDGSVRAKRSGDCGSLTRAPEGGGDGRRGREDGEPGMLKGVPIENKSR
jgi:hypothetical protein